MGASLNFRLLQLLKELGEAINASLGKSEQIAGAVSRIQAGGYDVSLVLEATVGFNERDEAEAKPVLVNAHRPHAGEPELKVDQQDMMFLKMLRISLGDPA